MFSIMKTLFNILNEKSVYQTVVILSFSYFIYNTLVLIFEEIITYGKNNYEKKKRATLTILIRNVVKYVTIIVDVMSLLSLYGVNIKGMLAGLGIAATVLGLALQDTFKDIINGINIIIENYFVVGDVVTYNNFTGTIVDFGLKSTKIKNANGVVLSVANRNIMEVRNLSQKNPYVYIGLSLPKNEDVSEYEKMIKTELIPKIKDLNYVISDSVSLLGVDEITDSRIKYLLVFTCERDKHWQIKRNVNKEISVVFKDANVTYPQLEVQNDFKL